MTTRRRYCKPASHWVVFTISHKQCVLPGLTLELCQAAIVDGRIRIGSTRWTACVCAVLLVLFA